MAHTEKAFVAREVEAGVEFRMIEKLAAGIDHFIRSYSATKFGIEQSIPFDADWLHLAIGPVIFVAAAIVLPKKGSVWHPWLAVVALAVLNELVDLTMDQSPNRTSAYVESATDFLLTIAIPTLLLIFARHFPTLYEYLGFARRQSR
jgi:hypothetical protein